MAKKRVHEIAKEQGLTSKQVIEALTGAGVYVKAASSAVEERDIKRAFPNGARAAAGEGAKSKSSKAAGKPAEPAEPTAATGEDGGSGDAAQAAAQAGDGAVAPGTAAKSADKPVVEPGDTITDAPRAPADADPDAGRARPVRAKAVKTGGKIPQKDGDGGSAAATKRAARAAAPAATPPETQRSRKAGGAAASGEAPAQAGAAAAGQAGETGQVKRPRTAKTPVQPQAEPVVDPGAGESASGADDAPAAAPDAGADAAADAATAAPAAPEATNGTADATTAPEATNGTADATEAAPDTTDAAQAEADGSQDGADGAQAAADAEAAQADADAPQKGRKRDGAAAKAEPPARGTGPRIIDPGTGSSRREGGAQRGGGGGGRPTRPESGGAAGGPGGRRRVVIDSQASRRPQGPPPPQQPPRRRRGRRRLTPLEEPAPTPTDVVIPDQIFPVASGATVKEVAETLGLPAAEVIKQLMKLGEMATLTQTLTDEAIEVLAEALDKKVEIVTAADEQEEVVPADADAPEDLAERPPVVTIMGHVDHGKTSLLDAIRETEVAAGEAGGITQHIGAYQVTKDGNAITFIDTPGHQAFTAMRARGAKVTDIAVIVVAADDGVMPQTVEAIDHAKAAGVPIMIAVNKIDKEDADANRVRGELAGMNLTPADWGGDTEFVDVSAKTRENLDQLLETIVTLADIQELKANPDADASGTVVESELDPGRGPVATVLVQRGTLHVGDALVAGASWARVRAMNDFRGQKVDAAPPGMPVVVLGFDSVPDAGEVVRAVENERKARQLAAEREDRLKREALARRRHVRISLEDVFHRAQFGEAPSLPLIVKADVAGSLEALEDEIAKLPQGEIAVEVIHDGVGGINESDVMLAAASDAIIIGFNVRPVGSATEVAQREGIEIRHYSVIYNVVDELRQAMQGLLAPEEVERTVATIEVRATFRASRIGTIAGCYVVDGTVRRGAQCRLVRDGTVVYDGRIGTLRRFKDDVREVQAGFECGVTLENFMDVKEGDVIEVYEKAQVERTLE